MCSTFVSYSLLKLQTLLTGLLIGLMDNYHFLLTLMYKKIKYQTEKMEQLEQSSKRNQVIVCCPSVR